MSMMQKLLEINDQAVALRTECEQLRSDQKTLQEICVIRGQRIAELEADLRKALGERDEAVEHAGRLQAELDAARRDLQALCTTTLPPKSTGSGLLRDVSHYTEAAEVDTPVADDAPIEPKVKVKVQEGWWSQRGHGEVYVRPTSSSPDNEPKRTKGYVWSDGVRLYLDNGRHSKDGQTPHDLVKFLGKHLKATNEKPDDAPTEPVQVQGEHELPEGWQVVPLNEELRGGDEYHSGLNRYIRRIKPEPEPENCGFEGKILHEVPQPVQVQEVTLSAYIVGDKNQPDALRIVWATEEWIQHAKFGIVHRMRDMHLFDNDGGCNITEYHETLTLTLKVQ